MKRIPYFLSVLNQFSWARTEPDGTCNRDLLKARIGVLGSGPTFGYWSVPGGVRPHDASPADFPAVQDPAYVQAMNKLRPRTKGYSHGDVLLGNEWLTDIEAWKLKDSKAVPLLFFTDETPPPAKAQPGKVKDWSSWYEWRGLGFNSPAALLMDYPLSVYYLLVDTLGVVDLDGTPTKRQTLKIHYIGAEVELNFLPL
jgi:hypothetical protein